MTSDTAIGKIILVGRDVDLWLAACVLQRALGKSDYSITVIELPSTLGATDMLASQPALEPLHSQIGIDERTLLKNIKGSYSLGQNFTDHSGTVQSFFHAFGSAGTVVQRQEFFPCWVKARKLGLRNGLADFSPTAVAAFRNRLLIPDEASDRFCRSDYGYHLPAAGYARNLRAIARHLGVRHVETGHVQVRMNGDDGAIAALVTDEGLEVSGDIFIDASGEQAVLIGVTLSTPWLDWRDHFVADRYVTALAPPFSVLPLFSEIRASDQGWTALYPAQAGTVVRHVYHSSATADDEAMVAARTIAGSDFGQSKIMRIEQGVRSQYWSGNCIAIGAAACRLDPIHDVDLHMLHTHLVNLLTNFPRTTAFQSNAIEYNKCLHAVHVRCRNFQQAHYRLARYDGAFWQEARTRDITPAVDHMIALFGARGEIAPHEYEAFGADSWRWLFTGHGLVPESWPPVVDRIAPEELPPLFNAILVHVETLVAAQQRHDIHLSAIAG